MTPEHRHLAQRIAARLAEQEFTPEQLEILRVALGGAAR